MKHLQVFANAAVWPVKATPVAADQIAIADSEATSAPKLVAISSLAGIPASNIPVAAIAGVTATDVQAAIAEHQADIAALQSLTGTYVGAATTVAGFATTDNEGNAIGNGDWAILSAVDGANAKGIWVYDGTSWGLAMEMSDIAAMVGATAGAAGTAGLAPAAAAGQQDFVLTGGGAYADATNLVPLYQGATAGAAGVKGLVNPAAAGDEAKFYSGAGTWLESPAASLQATTDVGSTTDNDIEITVATKGLIMQSPDGTRYRMTIDNDQSLVTSPA